MMNELTIHNVEAWLLDFIEGNLNEDQSKTLMHFLDENPEYAALLAEYENVTLVADEVSFTEKQTLKHAEYELATAFDTQCVTYHENLMSASQRQMFENELELDEQKRYTAMLYGKTKLIPDYSIRFFNKNSLKKKTATKRIILTLSYAAAASILLTAGVFIFEHYDTQRHSTGIASVNKSQTEESQQLKPQPKTLNNETEEQIPEEILAKDVPVTLASNKVKANKNQNVVVVKKDAKLDEQTLIDEEEMELANYHGISVLEPIKSEIINTGNEMVAITSIQSNRVVINNDLKVSTPLFLEKELNDFYAKARKSLENERNLTAYDWAKRIIKNVSNYTGAEMSLSRKVDANGNKEELAFESRFFGITRSSKK